MIAALKIVRVGKSAGIVLPDEVLARLGARVGDELRVVATQRGIEIMAKGR